MLLYFSNPELLLRFLNIAVLYCIEPIIRAIPYPSGRASPNGNAKGAHESPLSTALYPLSTHVD
jgi:hypothetical protein